MKIILMWHTASMVREKLWRKNRNVRQTLSGWEYTVVIEDKSAVRSAI